MDLESILNTIQPFLVMFIALLVAFLTAIWISAVIWAFRDIRARTRDVFAQILATSMVFLFFPLFPIPGLILYWILRPRETLTEIYERTLEEEALLQGIEERRACPACNRRIDEDFIVCPSCHTRLKKHCTSCGRHLHLRWNICPYCGAAQTQHAEEQLDAVVLPAEPAMIVSSSPSSLPEPEAESETQPILEGDFEDEITTPSDLAVEPEPDAEPEAEAIALSEADAYPDLLAEEGATSETEDAGAGEEQDVEAGDSAPDAAAEPVLETDDESEADGEAIAETEPTPDSELVEEAPDHLEAGSDASSDDTGDTTASQGEAASEVETEADQASNEEA